jgi:PAS domain S-box-containing protein
MLYEQILRTVYVYEHIIESMNDGVITIDNSGTITTVNPSAARILEMKKEDILNRKYSQVFIQHPENDDFNQTVLDAVYKSFVSHHKICSYYTGQSTKTLFVTTSLLKINIDNETKTVGINVVFSDITELQQLRNASVNLKIKLLGQQVGTLGAKK